MLSIGYSAINNITLDIKGKAVAIPITRILVAGETFNKMLKNSTSTSTANTNIVKIVFDYWKNGTPIDVDGLGGIKLFKSNDGKNVYILSETQIYANTNCGYMLRAFEGVSEIVFNNFNTAKVYNMSMMFGGVGLTEIDLSSFNTSKVQEMQAMFQSCKMSKLNLSNFNTEKVTDMSRMFYANKKMQTVYVRDKWTTQNVTTSGEEIFSCTSLVGGLGTIFDSNNIGITYARVDGGPESETPGYFTFKPIN